MEKALEPCTFSKVLRYLRLILSDLIQTTKSRIDIFFTFKWGRPTGAQADAAH